MDNITLLAGSSSLQNGKYIITRLLGQGGFGITYEAEQVSLGRKVAIKEFFMKEYCNRDSSTSRVSVPSFGSRELVERFRQKFLREARMIASFNHPNIVKIHDVFEENDTAYYVMEYLPGGSLFDKVRNSGALPEDLCLNYILQVSSALDYLHHRNILHFDVKPSNILFDEDSRAVLVDFGISKHYDTGGHQTSRTPIGLSKGYAPLEQYRQDDISTFTPSTDIYSLGATLYNLATGVIPPDASIVNEEGLERPLGISDCIWNTIEHSMQPRRKDRPQTIKEFQFLLEGTGSIANDTTTVENPKPVEHQSTNGSDPIFSLEPSPKIKKGLSKWLYGVIAVLMIVLVAVLAFTKSKTNSISKRNVSTTGINNGHEWVDLGLSVKWASCNIGASNSDQYGDYYAWGENEPKDSFYWTNYKFCTSGDFRLNNTLSKYTTDSDQGVVDNKLVLDSGDDVAHMKWGGNWRMPTKTEFEELINECSWIWVNGINVNGFKVFSKKRGYTDNYIFLPAGGGINFTYKTEIGSNGQYWTRNLAPSDNFGASFAFLLNFYSWGQGVIESDRYNGCNIRPVCPK